MKNILRRTERIAVLAVFLFCALFLRTAYAEDIEGTFPYETSGLSGEVEKAEFTYEYRDSYFTESSYTLNMDLARLSLRLSIAGFGFGKESDATSLKLMFDQLDVHYDESTIHYVVPGADTIGYGYGVRDLGDNRKLIVAVVRGGNYQQEWAGNFSLGLTEDHEGFRSCADLLVKDLQAYIATMPEGSEISLLMTGYSRAAAVSNLAAADLDLLASEAKLAGVTPERIYAYCLACPLNTRRTEEAAKALYGNIFSFVHPADPVPKVAPGQWGYGRFGKTYLLPTSINDDDYDTYYAKFEELFRRYAVTDRYLITAENVIAMDQSIAAMADTLMSPTVYVLTAQKTIRSAFLEAGDGLATVTEFLGGSTEPGDGDSAGNPFIAHAPEHYLAALDALEDGARLSAVRSDYGYLIFDGEFDVTIYDSEGKQVVFADWDKREITADDALGAAYGVGGKLMFDCPGNKTYYAVVVADDRLKVSIECGLFDSRASRDRRKHEYNKVLLKEDERLVIVLDPKEPALYRSNSGTAEELLAAILSGGTGDAEKIKASKTVVYESIASDEPTQPTPTPTATPTAEPTPTPEATPAPETTPTLEATPTTEPTLTPEAVPATITPTPAGTARETPAPTPTTDDATPAGNSTKSSDSNRKFVLLLAGAGVCLLLVTCFVAVYGRKKSGRTEEQTKEREQTKG
ncbi:MAG: hypothetical protein IK055_06475 [Lachnospiraceae bacterium]|nr:hypothetical protein [Lachnospiraceae bacterium]